MHSRGTSGGQLGLADPAHLGHRPDHRPARLGCSDPGGQVRAGLQRRRGLGYLTHHHARPIPRRRCQGRGVKVVQTALCCVG